MVFQEQLNSLPIMVAQNEEATNWEQDDDEEQIDENSI